MLTIQTIRFEGSPWPVHYANEIFCANITCSHRNNWSIITRSQTMFDMGWVRPSSSTASGSSSVSSYAWAEVTLNLMRKGGGWQREETTSCSYVVGICPCLLWKVNCLRRIHSILFRRHPNKRFIVLLKYQANCLGGKLIVVSRLSQCNPIANDSLQLFGWHVNVLCWIVNDWKWSQEWSHLKSMRMIICGIEIHHRVM